MMYSKKGIEINKLAARVHTVVDNREELQLQHLKAQKESGLQKRLEYFAK